MDAIETDFADTPAGWAQRWKVEFDAARKALETWHTTGDAIDKEFRNEVDVRTAPGTRLSVFSANVQSLMAMLFGQNPKSTVSRRFADAKDDVARVAGEMVERLINTDICRDGDTYNPALRCVLTDRLLPGFGNAKVSYDVGETVKTITGKDPVTGEDIVLEGRPHEDAVTEYYGWKDQLWSPAKVFHQATWWAFKNDMRRKKLVERFGEEIGNAVPLKQRTDKENKSPDPWGRAEVWEIWDKETKSVYWYVEGHPTTLDIKKDPLQLDGFWPFPEPLFANLTTSKLVPRPDYALHQDQYKQINNLVTRIDELTEAVRVSGCYDAEKGEVNQMLTEAGRGRLIPVQNWNAFVEKDGIRGAVDWFPVEQVVAAIAVLQERLSVTMDQLFQVTGWSDIMRGEATQAGATATEQRGKMKFGSVRIQRLQDEFARFASDLLKIKAQIIAKHFDPQTIIERSNAANAFDSPELVQQAVQLIKSGLSEYKIEVKPEAISLSDFAAQKQERTDVLAALTGFFQAIAPIAQQAPGATPFLLQMAQWTVAGVRGASQMEGVFDQMIQAAQQAAAQPQQQAPDPKLMAIQAKSQADIAKGKADLENDLTRIGVEVQADAQREANQSIENIKEHARKTAITAAYRPEPTANGRPKR